MIDEINFEDIDFQSDFEIGELNNFDISEVLNNAEISKTEISDDISDNTFFETIDDLKSILPIFENL